MLGRRDRGVGRVRFGERGDRVRERGRYSNGEEMAEGQRERYREGEGGARDRFEGKRDQKKRERGERVRERGRYWAERGRYREGGGERETDLGERGIRKRVTEGTE